MKTANIQPCCNFGEHLTIDGYGGDLEKLNSREIVAECLAELPDILKMNKLAAPEVYFAPDNGKKDPGGWSGVVIIAESHISIHTFPARRFVSIDVYSCRNGMSRSFIEKYFKERFDLQDLETNFIKRGTKYPLENVC